MFGCVRAVSGLVWGRPQGLSFAKLLPQNVVTCWQKMGPGGAPKQAQTKPETFENTLGLGVVFSGPESECEGAVEPLKFVFRILATRPDLPMGNFRR